jgi:hypothetical protein
MGIFDFLKKKQDAVQEAGASILPHEIYEANTLELKDIIAPSALKIGQKELNLGEKNSPNLLCYLIPTLFG